jgi:hypothetical protein
MSPSSPVGRRWLLAGHAVSCAVHVLHVLVLSRATRAARRGHMPWAGPVALGHGRPGHLGTVQPGLGSCWPGQHTGLSCAGWAAELLSAQRAKSIFNSFSILEMV